MRVCMCACVCVRMLSDPPTIIHKLRELSCHHICIAGEGGGGGGG